jgi:hypothetical protein
MKKLKTGLFCCAGGCLLLLLCAGSCSFGLTESDEDLVIFCYNTENLFDEVSDGSEYPEFDPRQSGWNEELVRRRLRNLSDILTHSSAGDPDILLFLEVENSRVVERLRDEYLSGKRYNYLYSAPSYDSPITLAALSRFPFNELKCHFVQIGMDEVGRCILEILFDYRGHRLRLFLNHWKSKSGGAQETEPLRCAAAAVICRRLRELLSADPDADILVAGDLNENPDEFERIGGAYRTALIPADADVPESYSGKCLFITNDRSRCGIIDDKMVLYSPWNDSGADGSYFYAGRWECIDHMLLSPGLFDTEGFSYRSFHVFDESFILTDSGFPFRWNSSNMNGYSDHLPIIMKLRSEAPDD